jgi:hypothetical protein
VQSVFICYRRGDGAYAGWLHERLTKALPNESVILDVETIPPGVNFVEFIRAKIRECDVVLVLIGRQWLTESGPDGSSRLNDAADYVRLEVATAISQNIQLLPVLLGGAVMPTRRELPDELRPLCEWNALPLNADRFNEDCARVITAVTTSLNSAREKRADQARKEEEAQRKATEAERQRRVEEQLAEKKRLRELLDQRRREHTDQRSWVPAVVVWITKALHWVDRTCTRTNWIRVLVTIGVASFVVLASMAVFAPAALHLKLAHASAAFRLCGQASAELVRAQAATGYYSDKRPDEEDMAVAGCFQTVYEPKKEVQFLNRVILVCEQLSEDKVNMWFLQDLYERRSVVNGKLGNNAAAASDASKSKELYHRLRPQGN